jgi:hypothetical protein
MSFRICIKLTPEANISKTTTPERTLDEKKWPSRKTKRNGFSRKTYIYLSLMSEK